MLTTTTTPPFQVMNSGLVSLGASMGPVQVLYVFITNYKKLNSVVKSYLSVILPDVFMVINFLPRDMYNMHMGRLMPGGWCALSGFVAIVAITALNSGAVCIAFATYRSIPLRPVIPA
jgi:hypothetical protein